ncbi:MAG TPA: FxDxF family PEP-CTERM protein [Burkholderiaceae bacterium]|nr:FxDxF family PEP-CTERM protein [Burkholderiaceae bacterium]
MKFDKIIAAAALSLAAASSFADSGGGALDLSTGSTFFGRTPSGSSFVDTYTFTLTGGSFLTTGSVDSSAIGGQDIDFTGITIMRGATTVASFANGGTDAQEHYTLAQTLLTPGNYALVVTGTQSVDAASYAGNLAMVAAPVPEPEAYAMLIAGLGVLGFVARRRRQR